MQRNLRRCRQESGEKTAPNISTFANANQGVRFHSGRFNVCLPGLLSYDCLVSPGEDGVPADFVTGGLAAWRESTDAHRRSARSKMCRGKLDPSMVALLHKLRLFADKPDAGLLVPSKNFHLEFQPRD